MWLERTLGNKVSVSSDDSWREFAMCRGKDVNVFIPKKMPGVSLHREIAKAKAICSNCLVKEPCLEYALTFDKQDLPGVYGGLTDLERTSIRRERKGLPPLKSRYLTRDRAF